ncbi:hypothetical protein J6590_042087 [Homalodisca vitripennis]|nr:hypothetical protein J6590_042087 [Homalodisca vitripennis]
MNLQFTFLLVQRLGSDAVTDVTPEVWSHVRLKKDEQDSSFHESTSRHCTKRNVNLGWRRGMRGGFTSRQILISADCRGDASIYQLTDNGEWSFHGSMSGQRRTASGWRHGDVAYSPLPDCQQGSVVSSGKLSFITVLNDIYLTVLQCRMELNSIVRRSGEHAGLIVLGTSQRPGGCDIFGTRQSQTVCVQTKADSITATAVTSRRGAEMTCHTTTAARCLLLLQINSRRVNSESRPIWPKAKYCLTHLHLKWVINIHGLFVSLLCFIPRDIVADLIVADSFCSYDLWRSREHGNGRASVLVFVNSSEHGYACVRKPLGQIGNKSRTTDDERGRCVMIFMDTYGRETMLMWTICGHVRQRRAINRGGHIWLWKSRLRNRNHSKSSFPRTGGSKGCRQLVTYVTSKSKRERIITPSTDRGTDESTYCMVMSHDSGVTWVHLYCWVDICSIHSRHCHFRQQLALAELCGSRTV